MRATRAKKIRHAMTVIYNKFKPDIDRACQDKFDMPNRYGRRQHAKISPKRLLKKMIRRNAFA